QNAPSSTSSMRHPASAWKAMNQEFWLRAEGELYGECLQELPDMVQAFQRLYVHLYERMLADLRLPESWETNLYRLEKQLCGGQHAYHQVNPRYKDRLAERANARDKEQTASRSTCVALIASITERHRTMEVGQVWTMDASVYLVSRMLGGMDALLHLAVPGTDTFHTDGTWLSQLLPEADLISFSGIDRAALERSGIG
ncbi:MAG: hypothetical protein AAGB22_06295, partial [Bacteroidota bacterium]